MEFRGFGQKALALKAKLNETYVRDILKGKSRNPTQSRLRKVAEALDCSVEDLTGDATESRHSDPARVVWNAVYDRLSPAERDFLIRSAQGLARDDPPVTPIPHQERPPPPRPRSGGSAIENSNAGDCAKVVHLARTPA
jgi:transcriptional regulator with XRE-family HTH domain